MRKIDHPNRRSQAANVTLAVFDVDGITTDESLHFLPDGREVKIFNAADGLGVKLLHSTGTKTAIITGRRSPQAETRSEVVGITYLRQGRDDKLAALKEIRATSAHSKSTTADIGDDLPDLSAITAVTFGATVPNAHSFLLGSTDLSTSLTGGFGAAREFSEAILYAQEKLSSAYERFL